MSDIGKGPKSIIKWGNTIREFSHYFGWTFGDFYDSSVVPYSEPQKFSFNATNQASTLAATQNLNSASIQTNTYNTEVTTNNYTLTVDQNLNSASIQTNTYNTEVTTNNYTLTVDQEID